MHISKIEKEGDPSLLKPKGLCAGKEVSFPKEREDLFPEYIEAGSKKQNKSPSVVPHLVSISSNS